MTKAAIGQAAVMNDQIMVKSWLLSYIEQFKQPNWTYYAGFYTLKNNVDWAGKLLKSMDNGLKISMVQAVGVILVGDEIHCAGLITEKGSRLAPLRTENGAEL